jgi:hypothetical protein
MADAQNMRQAGSRTLAILAAICLLVVGLATHTVAQSGRRLILNDGSWQEITQYELHGDRVRYFSSQRSEWEELPRELVDWKATEAWNARRNEKSSELKQFEAEEQAEREADAAKRPAVAPGLRLPVRGGVFMLDRFSGEPSLDELAQSGSALSNETGRNILRLPINRKASTKQRFELKGRHARVQAHVPLPEIFVNIDEEAHAQQIARTEHFRILRLEPNENSRVLMKVEVSVLGKQSQSQQYVSTRVAGFKEGWLKITPLAALEPGEYALVEMLGPNEFNSYVWDFGVDPDAAANPNPLEPEIPASEK